MPIDARSKLSNTKQILSKELLLLYGNQLPSGYHFIEWDGKSIRGERTNAGTYFHRLTASLSNGESISSMKKFVVIE